VETSEYAERMNILIVDDLPEKLLAYEAILEEMNQNLLMARSGEEALRLVLQNEFAVILLDVNLPGMDGFETASLIRQRKKSAHTPIIFLTAFTDEMRMAQGYASGAVDYLPTPVVPEVLKAKVKVFIELSQMKQQAASRAKEHALRTSAEASARRSEFRVTAREVLDRSQNYKTLLHALVRLPLPYLADMCVVWQVETAGQLKCVERAWIGSAEEIQHPEFTDTIAVPSELEKIIRETMETGECQILSCVRLPFVFPEDDFTSGTALVESVLVLPLITQAQPSRVLVLMRRKVGYASNDITLANDLASCASMALENIMLMEKIHEADQRKDEFLATLAHELRNPLAPLSNALHIMKMSRDLDLRKETEEVIERQLKHMIRLVDDLMDISRITQGKIELAKERVLLKDVFCHGIEAVQPLLKQRDHLLTITLPEQALWLDVDSVRISQIISNLLTNAAKYTNIGGHIEIEAQQEGEWAVITVRDNGIGIAADMLPRVFDLFLQVDSSLERAQGGLGIGLTLVKKLTEMHGGSIEAFSNGLYQGSEFRVRLPMAAMPHADISEKPGLEAMKSSPLPLRILVVDDNETAARMLGWMIELSGHHIHLAHDGVSAIEIARTCKPAVILLDIGMPGMNGYEVCKAMHNEPSLKNTVFIAQTGWGQAEHRQRSKEAGFDYHLVKPVSPQIIQELLDNVAGVRGQETEEKPSFH